MHRVAIVRMVPGTREHRCLYQALVVGRLELLRLHSADRAWTARPECRTHPMATKCIPQPRDPIALAKLIGDIAAGGVSTAVEDETASVAVKTGRAYGLIRCAARAESMTAESRNGLICRQS